MRRSVVVPLAMVLFLGVGGAKQPAKQPAPSQESRPRQAQATQRVWTVGEVTGLAKACAESYHRNGYGGPTAERLCMCVATGMSQVLPPGWLDDGKPVSAAEKAVVGAITTDCAEQSKTPTVTI